MIFALFYFSCIEDFLHFFHEMLCSRLFCAFCSFKSSRSPVRLSAFFRQVFIEGVYFATPIAYSIGPRPATRVHLRGMPVEIPTLTTRQVLCRKSSGLLLRIRLPPRAWQPGTGTEKGHRNGSHGLSMPPAHFQATPSGSWLLSAPAPSLLPPLGGGGVGWGGGGGSKASSSSH